ncbi:unnamed protein product, partial [Darwinula stevensoni]
VCKLNLQQLHQPQMNLRNVLLLERNLYLYLLIETTLAKAKELRVHVEPIINRSKDNTTHSRRTAFSHLQNKYAAKELFDVVGPKVANRPGGYTRIIKLGKRLGDNAEMAMIELVDFNELYTANKSNTNASAEPKKRTRRAGTTKKKEEESTETETNTATEKDGTHYEANACGKIGTATGEICFNTSMTGYHELFTDPSYYGQLLISTNVHVGNYGIKHQEEEANQIQIAGLICREYTNNYSRIQANQNIQSYFEENNLVGVTNLDTRAIVRHVREKGAMNAIISSEINSLEELNAILKNVPSMDGLELASKVSTKTAYTMGNENATYKIAALDL